jgi:hypothetical protein
MTPQRPDDGRDIDDPLAKGRKDKLPERLEKTPPLLMGSHQYLTVNILDMSVPDPTAILFQHPKGVASTIRKVPAIQAPADQGRADSACNALVLILLHSTVTEYRRDFQRGQFPSLHFQIRLSQVRVRCRLRHQRPCEAHSLWHKARKVKCFWIRSRFSSNSIFPSFIDTSSAKSVSIRFA